MHTDRLRLLLQFHEEDPSDAFTRFALASEYAKRNEVGKARTLYEGLVTDVPDYTGTYYHLGKLHERAGRIRDAMSVYRRGIAAAQAAHAVKDLSELRAALLELED